MEDTSKRGRIDTPGPLNEILKESSDSEDDILYFPSISDMEEGDCSSGIDYDSDDVDGVDLAMLGMFESVGSDSNQFSSNKSDAKAKLSQKENDVQPSVSGDGGGHFGQALNVTTTPGQKRKHGGNRSEPAPWNWSRVQHPREFRPDEIALAANERILPRMGCKASAIDFFHLYISNEFIAILVEETNRFAQQYRNTNKEDIDSGRKKFDWNPVNLDEMKTFIGLTLLMGINYLPEINLYWSTNELFHTSIYSETMPRNRFKQILRFWHFNNNENYIPKGPNPDRLYKIRRVMDCFRANCKHAFEPGRNVCVDESLLLFKGRLKFKQYIKTKRARSGVKFYELCTSSGILLDFLIYCGMKQPEIEGLSTTEAGAIVATLMQPYLEAGRCVFLDNFYTSPNLAKWLLARKTYICGTVKPNRKQFPKELAEASIEKGESIFYKCESEKILAVKFRALKDKSDKKPKVVHLLATADEAISASSGRKDKDGNDVVKPLRVLNYNCQMGGIDLVDQQLHSFRTCRKTYTWPKKVVTQFIMQGCLSASKLYNIHEQGKTTFLNFLKEVITALLTCSPKLNKPLMQEHTIQRLTGRHFPVQRAIQPGGGRRKTKICKVCYARGLRTTSGRALEVITVCQNCPSHPGLHVDRDCFRVYHTQVDFSQPARGEDEDY